MIDPKLKEQLKPEYRTVFDRVEGICIVEQQSDAERHARMEYLLDVFLTAQNDGIPVQKIVGKDLQTFCSAFLDASDAKLTVRYFRRMLKQTAQILLWMVGFFEILPFLVDWAQCGDILQAVFCSDSAILVWLFGSVVCILVHGLVTRHVLRYMILRLKTYRHSYLHAVTAVNIVLYMILLNVSEYLGSYVLLLPRWAGLLAFACLLLWKVTERVLAFLRRPKLQKGERRIRSSYEALSTNVIGSLNRYKRLNRKRIAKGKSPLSETEFMADYHKQARQVTPISVATCAFFNLFLMGGEILDFSDTSGLLWAWLLFGTVCLAEYLVIRNTCRVYKDLSYLCTKYNRTLFDDDIGELIQKHTVG